MTRKTDKERREALAIAYGRLSADGQRVTVRALAAEAKVAGEAARRFLADRLTEITAPEAPQEVTELLATVWAAAYRLAAQEAEEATSAKVAELLAGQEADAHAVAQATQATQEADTRCEAAQAAQQQAEQHAAELRARLTDLEAELAQARQAATEARHAQAAAEATARTLQTAFDQLTERLSPHRRSKEHTP